MTAHPEPQSGLPGYKPPSLAKNTAFNMASSIIRLVIGLVVSPILFWKLGAESYGLWSVIWAVSGTLGLMDMRLGMAAIPLVSTARESGDIKQIIRFANTGFFFYGLLGIATLLAAAGLTRIPVLFGWFPEGAQEYAGVLVFVAVLIFGLSTLASLSSGFLQGLQRYDTTSKIDVLVGVIRASLLISIALAGGGLKELVLAEAGAVSLRCLLFTAAVRRNIPGFRFLPRPDRDSFRILFSFGAKLEAAHVAHIVSMHFDKLLLTVFLGLEFVAYYDLGAKLVSVARSLPVLLISATIPVASSLEASGERKRLWDFYLRGTSVLAWSGMPVFLWAAVGAGPLLFAWAGVTAVEARITIWILSTGFFLNVYSGMANSVALGVGKPELEMRRSMLTGILNIILSAGLIILIGFPGAPLGTSMAFIAGSLYLFSAVHSHFGRPLLDSLKPLLPTLIPLLPAGLGAYAIMRIAGESRVETIVGVICASLFVGAVYLLAAVRAGIISKQFWESIRNPVE